MELVRIINALQKKIDEDKQKLADAKANKRALEARVTDLSDELIKLMGTNTLKEAFTKIYQLTELEKSLETVIQEVLVCYNSGELSKLNELNSRVGVITSKIEDIKNSKVEIPAIEESVEEPEKEIVKEEPEKEILEEEVKKEIPPKQEPVVKKKVVIINDDDDEDLID